LESSWALFQYSAKKMANFQKSKYLLQNLVIKQKKRRKITLIAKKYTLLKSQQIQMCRNICKIFKTCVFKKTENVQISSKGVCAKICAKFLCRVVQSSFVLGFPKSYKMWLIRR